MCRPAYTLMEMLVVLAIIVAAAAIGVPSVQSMLTDSRISSSADIIRGAAAEARAQAMDQGVPWRVAFMPHTGVYQLAPEDAADWDDTSNQKETQQKNLFRHHLPKDIIFAVNETDISGAGGSGSSGGWATLAVYLPDGSARDDTTIYFGKKGIVPMRIRIRGLTGHVSVETPFMVKENPE